LSDVPYVQYSTSADGFEDISALSSMNFRFRLFCLEFVMMMMMCLFFDLWCFCSCLFRGILKFAPFLAFNWNYKTKTWHLLCIY